MDATTKATTSLQTSVLALNRMYMALQVVSAKRAFCLLWKGFAEVISIEDGAYMAYDFESWIEFSELRDELFDRDEHEDWIRSINYDIQIPRVIRLLNYDRVPKNVVKFSRRNIFLRDEHCCQYCGNRFGTSALSLDHVIPRSRGGPTNWENIVAACLRCNVRKGGRTPQEAGMRLSRRPIKPKNNPMLAFQRRHEKYEVWNRFLE